MLLAILSSLMLALRSFCVEKTSEPVVMGSRGRAWRRDRHRPMLQAASDVELRNVIVRQIGGDFAVFTSARRKISASNSYREVHLVNLTADSPVAFWGRVRKLK